MRTGRKYQMKMTMTRRVVLAAAAATLAFGGAAQADDHQMLEQLHFIVPGGAGGGWDGAARGTGEALTESGLVGSASFENMSGGRRRCRDRPHDRRTPKASINTLMVNSDAHRDPLAHRRLPAELSATLRSWPGPRGTTRRSWCPPTARSRTWTAFWRPMPSRGWTSPSAAARCLGGMDHLVVGDGDARGRRGPNGGQLHSPMTRAARRWPVCFRARSTRFSTGFSEAIALADQGEVAHSRCDRARTRACL